MRWSIIRTIWFREMRDQLRDRRTLLMILGLPLILYPILGFAVLQFAEGLAEKPSVIGVVVGSSQRKDFPPREPPEAGRSVVPAFAWLAATPIAGSEIGACALAQASHLNLDYPPLIEAGQFTIFDSKLPRKAARAEMAKEPVQIEFLDHIPEDWQKQRKLDVILKAPEHFFTKLDDGDEIGMLSRPLIQMQFHPGDHRSQVAQRRITTLLEIWKADLKRVRLARKGLTEKYLDPFEVGLPDEPTGSGSREKVISMVIRIFPLFLVMWTLSGALYPAVDLCAGEKERGTMETLLITPAGREEIVLGKFLTIWVFSSATALLNLFSMGVTTSMLSSHMPQGVSIAALAWCVVLSLPQAAFFSALGLAIGAYARSSKEGQYYLMPLFVLTMPLIFLTLVPGVELNALYALVPVTGVALLMQQLMTAPSLRQVPWSYFVPVLAPVALYSWLALRWAIVQFNREEVLFREAERLDLLLWVKRLVRDKMPMPTTGEVFFCLAVLIGLRWLTLGMGSRWSLEMNTAISQLAFVAMPPLFMTLLLTTQPAMSLYLRWPRRREAGLAALLAILLLPPMTGLTQAAADWFPELLRGTHPLIKILVAIHEGKNLGTTELLTYLLAFALVPALCEEIAFRGFVLRGLHQGFRPRNAVLLSSFFFALFHMNVFLFVPMFVFGVILGLLTIRSRSLLPAVSFHLLHNSVLIALIPLSYSTGMASTVHDAMPWVIGGCLTASLALVWWLYRKPYIELAREEALHNEPEA
jgi:sodium transport system permease protein